MSRKPNYLLIGSMKCGTSSLCCHLDRHPDVFMYNGRNPNFFGDDGVYAKGFNWYESLFEAAQGKRIIGQSSNKYSEKENFPETIARIWKYSPQMKLIYLVRNPIRRMESRWIQKRSQGDPVSYSFCKTVLEDRAGYIDASNYWRQLNAYRNYFPDEQILVLFTEDFRSDPAAELHKCFKFLKVDPEATLPKVGELVNVSEGKSIVSLALPLARKMDILHMRKLLNKPFRQHLKKKFFRHRYFGRPQWDEKTADLVLRELREDTAEFLKFCGKHENFWNLDFNFN